uniref:Programmed cell death protein 5 n=1 Tax=Oryza meridionalis TaxID=40149 RepID=A0A0E0DUE7_9ORYZ
MSCVKSTGEEREKGGQVLSLFLSSPEAIDAEVKGIAISGERAGEDGSGGGGGAPDQSAGVRVERGNEERGKAHRCGYRADPELEAIRQRRMQELMAQRGAANPQNAGQQKAQEDAKQEAEERRQMMLAQILSSEARERLSRIALVKPDKARGVEDVLLRAAQSGGISEKVSEERLISLLEQINTHTSKQTKVTIQRRRSILDDDD